ncbi:MAG: 1,4-dihydroxy-2-naphthoate octaprenyltransferase [Verrucomicrobia bacterium]|nr:1,4-dihydroxy-2-naphthoate octaprenyltransferase [Verrucomicrobiota bacterium]
MSSLKTWVMAARPKTLPAALVPVWVGSALVSLDQSGQYQFSGRLLFYTLLSCLLIQIATNFFNDAIDFQKGADTNKRHGPRRVTASGLVSQRQVMVAGVITVALAVLASFPLLGARGWPIVLIGAISLLLAYGYTGGPFPLAYLGLGELFVVVFFGLIAVGGSWFVQTGVAPGPVALLAGLQIGLLSAALIAINNLRDIDEDRLSGKRTLAVRKGIAFAKMEIALFCLGPSLVGTAWLALGYGRLYAIPLVLTPFSLYIAWKVFRTAPSPEYNKFLALAAMQLMIFAILFTIGLMA